MHSALPCQRNQAPPQGESQSHGYAEGGVEVLAALVETSWSSEQNLCYDELADWSGSEPKHE